MSIEALGAVNLEQARFDISRFDPLRKAGAGFAALLEPENTGGAERADGAQEAGGADGRGRKPVIDKKDKLYEQCEALETFFLKNMINGMRKTVNKSEFIKTGFAGEMYEDMLWDEYAKDFAQNARLGFAELAYLELTGQRGKLLNTPV